MYFDFYANNDNIKPLAQYNIRHNIGTLSLFRFWARSNVREFLWAKTRLNNEPFDYRGNGDELFKGFGLALLGIFAPFYLIKIIIEISDNKEALAIFGLFSSLFISFIAGFGIYRARAYILSRTYYRGIGFGLEKGALGFAFKFMLHTILLGISLGWWHPNMRKSISKHLWSRTYWGHVKFRYNEGQHGEKIFGPFAVGWFGFLFLGFILFSLIAIIAIPVLNISENETSPFLAALISYGILALSWLLASLTFGSYRGTILRRITKSISLDDAKFNSILTGADFFNLTVKNAFLSIFTFGLAAPYIALSYWKLIIENIEIELPPQGLRTIFEAQYVVEDTAEGIDDTFELPFFDMSPV